MKKKNKKKLKKIKKKPQDITHKTFILIFSQLKKDLDKFPNPEKLHF